MRMNKLSTRKRQKKLQDTHDWISSLPDELLLHILSFLPTEDVTKTSTLSRRWTDLWKFAHCLKLSEGYRNLDMVPIIDKIIAHHMGTKLRKFQISFRYKDTDAPKVDSWIHFAERCNVEQMELDLLNCLWGLSDYGDDKKYKLPHTLFQCGSLKVLSITGCSLFNPPTSLNLRSLKKLTLRNLDISSDAFQHLTSCCPLEDLFLLGCNEGTDLTISDASGNLKTLRIDEYGNYDDGCQTTITVDAPNLGCIELVSCLAREDYRIKGQSTPLIASFVIIPPMVMVFADGDRYTEFCGYNLARTISSLHIKYLRLCGWCIQVLTLLERVLDEDMSINATSIELHSGFTKWEIPGIAYILRNSQILETLKIYIYKERKIETNCYFKRKYNFNEERFWELQKNGCMLLPIRTVAIHGFPNGRSNSKGHKRRDYNNAVRFVRFLLKNLKVLERVTIFIETNTNKKSGSHTPATNNSELLHDITGGNDDFCKASSDAVLCISQVSKI